MSRLPSLTAKAGSRVRSGNHIAVLLDFFIVHVYPATITTWKKS